MPLPVQVFVKCSDGKSRLVEIVSEVGDTVVLARKGRTWVTTRRRLEAALDQ